jgi:glucuronoarabinoxylan endo-1,4-beta-xylanase
LAFYRRTPGTERPTADLRHVRRLTATRHVAVGRRSIAKFKEPELRRIAAEAAKAGAGAQAWAALSTRYPASDLKVSAFLDAPGPERYNSCDVSEPCRINTTLRHIAEDSMFLSPRRARAISTAVAGLLGVGTLVALTQAPAAAATAVSVNGATTYQTIDGFGVSEAFGQANAIRTLTGTARKQALDLLFNTGTGAGFSILRSLIPSGSDSIEPNSPGSPSATPTYVWDGTSDTTDQGQLWLAKQAKTYGVSDFYNDAWSAPGYMKTNGSNINGGSLCGTAGATCSSGDWRQAYANYLVQDARFWSSAGLTPSAIDFVNEPSLTTSYDSMLVTSAQAASFLSVFGPTMKASGLSTRVACCDTLGFNVLPGYVSAVQGDATANADVGLFTSHGYSGAPSSPIGSNGRPVWESEWSINGSNWDTAWDDGTADSGFSWAQNVQTGMTGANLSAFLYWWGISNTSHDSSLIGLSGSTLTPSKRYYALANYSRFIRPGAVRISATSAASGLSVSAYRNTDGSVIVVALNTAGSDTAASYSLTSTNTATGTATPYLTNASNSTTAQSAIGVSGGTFSATVPARSLVTYRITGSGGTTASPTPSASTSPSPSTSPTPSASASPTGLPSGTPSSSATGCTATYSITSSWPGGFQASVTVANSSATSTTSGWTVRWTLPSGQAITQLWNGSLTTAGGSNVTVTSLSYNGTLAPGAATSFGFTGTGSSTPTPTVSCTST